ncbi:MAG: formylglycine-generating enzyme family protein [Lentisphaerales bacterium]|nr:formylglycine-generating enzyme family protein [Lentisphaerales bacterium]
MPEEKIKKKPEQNKPSKLDLKSKIKPEQLQSLKKKSTELKEKLAKEQLEEKIKMHTKSPVKVLALGLVGIVLVLASITHFRNKADRLSGGIDPRSVPKIAAKGELAQNPANNELPFGLLPAEESHYAKVPESKLIGPGAIQAVANQKASVEKFNLPLEINDKYNMAFRLIPPGKFLMGSPKKDDDPSDVEFQHFNEVKRPVYVGKYEVTVEQWQKVMGNLPHNSTKIKNNPVTGVSLNDCLTFIQMINRSLDKDSGYRYYLISENEWEYSCRAGTEGDYSFGPRIAIDDYAVYRSNTRTHNVEPVGSRLPNAFGLFDMHGNAIEWTRTPFFIYACNENQYAGITMQQAKAANIKIKDSSWDTPLYDGEYPENLITPLDNFNVPTRTIGSNLDLCYHDTNNNDKYDNHEAIWKDHLSEGSLNVFDPGIDKEILMFAKKIPEGAKGAKNGLFYYDKNSNTEWDPNEELWVRNDAARNNHSYYVLRGGAFYFTEAECRSAYRARVERQNAPTYAGLRLVIYLNKFATKK